MRKVSFLIALCMLLTIGGVYATWTYTQSTDVADETINLSMNLTSPAFIGTNGTFEIDQSGLTMVVDPKQGTSHVTALYITGQLVIKFTPNIYATDEVKANAVEATYTFSLTNNWQYNGENVVTLAHPEEHDIEWVKQDDGSFTMTITAEALAEHIVLTEFTLDTKAKYDAYGDVLGDGSIKLTVSDGVTTQQ